MMQLLTIPCSDDCLQSVLCEQLSRGFAYALVCCTAHRHVNVAKFGSELSISCPLVRMAMLENVNVERIILRNYWEYACYIKCKSL